jgi:large subunit ribosomal protein LP0
MPTVSAEKEEYAVRMNKLLDTYSKVLFCNLDNVRSMQMHAVRKSLRGRGEMLVGKKTMQKRILAIRADSEGASELDKKLHHALVEENRLVGNLALVFTNDDVSSIRELLREHRVQAPARVGAVAPVDVTILAGNTGLEPTVTSFFQALNIPTKIAKGTVEITADKKVLSVGDKVDSSTAALLQKLNISPFFYAAEVEFYWQKGMLFTAEDLSTTGKLIEDAVASAIASLQAVSLATGILTEASFPHAIMDGFKSLLGASVESEYVFEEFNGKSLRADVKSGKTAAAAAPAAAAPAAGKPAAPAKVEEPEEEEDFGMGGLF